MHIYLETRPTKFNGNYSPILPLHPPSNGVTPKCSASWGGGEELQGSPLDKGNLFLYSGKDTTVQRGLH